MISEVIDILMTWRSLDTWTVVTAALAAMACVVPGVFLVVRHQSMMGDALSHTTLPGVVIAFLLAHWLRNTGWLSAETYDATRHSVMFGGALVIGVLSTALTEAIQKLGKVEASAALGVVFTTLFAIGLLLIRIAADSVHIDPDCVLYGTVETVAMDTIGTTGVPRAAVSNGIVLILNLILVALFFKELRISAFDEALSTTVGINAQVMHYGLMAITAATLVSAFETVGSILVIAMLIAPPATAHLLTDRLSMMILLGLVIASLAAVLGYAMAITLPQIIFSRLGVDSVGDASAAGMIAVASGILFCLALFLGPRYGILSRVIRQTRLGLRIAGEDVLGLLYRAEEARGVPIAVSKTRMSHSPSGSHLIQRMALRRLIWTGAVQAMSDGYCLTSAGRGRAELLVRSHRLWESYMAKHFELPDDHLHETAARVEHYIGDNLRDRLADELDAPEVDPHGQEIPPSKP